MRLAFRSCWEIVLLVNGFTVVTRFTLITGLYVVADYWFLQVV